MTLSDTDVERIVSAAETMETSLAVLADKQDGEEYAANRETRDVVERRFVKLTEAALDIPETLVVHERDTRPESNPATMVARGRGRSRRRPHRRMTEAARFRNVLAHTYGDAIDHDDVYDALQDLDRYRAFLVAIRDHLDARGALD